jgi:hypothetical protein
MEIHDRIIIEPGKTGGQPWIPQTSLHGGAFA